MKPGERIRRTELHDQFGGGRQGGISPSRQSPNVLIFSDPEVGPEYGYFDRWHADGLFHYTGEGQKGDQEMARGNAAILNHRDAGRRLRVFEGVRDEVKYVGEFEVDREQPYYRTDAPEFGSDRVRQVIVFRLRPIDAVKSGQDMTLDLLPKAPVTEVDIESNNTESTFVHRAQHRGERYQAAQRPRGARTAGGDAEPAAAHDGAVSPSAGSASRAAPSSRSVSAAAARQRR